jgi:hypothetical protein
MLKPAIDRPSRQPRATIVVKNVAVDYLKKAGGRVPKHGQVIESKGETSWVSTRDPLSPRRFPVHPECALFSITYVSIRYGPPVEAC